jgi:hypothetical protein
MEILVNKQDILRFDITMDNVTIMLHSFQVSIELDNVTREQEMTYQILDALEQLNKQFPALGLGEFLLHDDEVEEFSFWGELKNEIDGLVFMEGILQAQDVGVTDTHEHGNLLLQTFVLGLVLTGPRCPSEDLDGVPHAG